MKSSKMKMRISDKTKRDLVMNTISHQIFIKCRIANPSLGRHRKKKQSRIVN